MKMAADEETSSLVVILDVNPVWWGQRRLKDENDLTLSQCIDSVMILINSHLMLHHTNKVAVIASHTNKSHFLYPSRTPSLTEESEQSTADLPRDGKYEHFARVDDAIFKEVKQLMTEQQEELHTDTLLAGSLAMGLCYIHRLEKEAAAGEKLRPRVLVIRAADDSASQYMDFMNIIFTAQKQNVIIDACILDKDSGLLQQACDITGGIYLKIPQRTGLLQYLLWVFLPSPGMRSKLVLPPAIHVDYRAACFCHRTLIDIGYVCSVCLSIFCNFSPICTTCHTAFKLKGPPLMRAKKKKRSTPVEVIS
ncbi:general transcription factor IIH subunit 3-like [Glandiceps talaboti]